MVPFFRSFTGNQVPPDPRLKRILYAIGAALCVLSVAFLVWGLASQAHRIRDLGYLDLSPLALLLAAGLYGLSLLTTATAWPVLVHGSVTSKPEKLVLIGLATQIGKYIPGNIASYVGRATLAQSQRVDLRRSASTTFLELGTAVFAGMLVGLLSFVLAPQSAAIASRHSLPLQALGATALVVLVWFAWRNRSLKLVVQATAIFVGSFLLAGASLYLTNLAFEEPKALGLAYSVSSFAFAWVAGFVVLGAPAGLGVREAVLVGLLAPVIGLPQAMMLTVLHRIVTILVDLVFGVGANLMLARVMKPND